jgi:hypothetical protein
VKNNIDPIEELQRILKQAFPDDKTITTHLSEILDFAKTVKVDWYADEISRKVGIVFLNEADRDLKSCKRLYSPILYNTIHWSMALGNISTPMVGC